MDNTFVSKFNVKYNDKNVFRPLYVKIFWKENENELFQIKIFDGENTWTGRYSLEFANKYMRTVVETEEDYKKNVKKALTEKDRAYTYFFSGIPDDSISATFSWRKTYKGSSLPSVHGSVPVHQDDVPESKDILIDYLIRDNEDLRQCIEAYTKRNDALNADLEECKSKLEKFIDIKTSLETSLYGKFVQLLNTKKKRIALLEENLQKYEETSISTELD